MPPGVRIQRLSHQVTEGRTAVIEFPQRGGGNEVAEMGGAASCKERGGDRCDASNSQAVTT